MAVNLGVHNDPLKTNSRLAQNMPIATPATQPQQRAGLMFNRTDDLAYLSNGTNWLKVLSLDSNGVAASSEGLAITESTTVPGGAPAAGSSTLWVRDDVPNVLVFTDDAGTDHDVSLVRADVTQLTSLVTGVTANGTNGIITTVSATTAGVTTESFTVTDSYVTATSVIQLTATYTGAGIPVITTGTVGAGSFVVRVTNAHATIALNAVLNIHYTVQ